MRDALEYGAPLAGARRVDRKLVSLISLINLLKETERGLAHSARTGLYRPMGPQMAPKWSLNALRGGLAIIILKVLILKPPGCPFWTILGPFDP